MIYSVYFTHLKIKDKKKEKHVYSKMFSDIVEKGNTVINM